MTLSKKVDTKLTEIGGDIAKLKISVSQLETFKLFNPNPNSQNENTSQEPSMADNEASKINESVVSIEEFLSEGGTDDKELN